MPSPTGLALVDRGGQVLIGRFELVEPRLAVAALAPGNVCGEIFDVNLESSSVSPETIQSHAALLDHEDRMVAVADQGDLGAVLVRLIRVFRQNYEPPRGFARLYASRALPPACMDGCTEAAVASQVALASPYQFARRS